MPYSYPSVNSLKNNLSFLLAQGKIKHVFPGGCAGISFPFKGDRKRVISCSGEASVFPEREKLRKENLFDLASLTKPLATTLAILSLLKKNIIKPEDRLDQLLERDTGRDKKEISLFHLLNHCSGLPAYKPFYKEISSNSWLERKEEITSDILFSPLQYLPGEEAVYSDPGFILLGRVVEIKGKKPLDAFFSEEILAPLGIEKSFLFNPLKKINPISSSDFAATEYCPWRKRVVRGEVHDENTCFTGGVSGQAGLFGDVETVLILTEFINDMWKGRKKHPNIRNSDLQYFLKKQNIVKNSSWALGFDTPSAERSSAGKLMSRKSAGHLGFTGTSFWIDPERDLVIVLLTNRIHPTRENIKIREFRPFFHDEVVSMLGEISG